MFGSYEDIFLVAAMKRFTFSFLIKHSTEPSHLSVTYTLEIQTFHNMNFFKVGRRKFKKTKSSVLLVECTPKNATIYIYILM